MTKEQYDLLVQYASGFRSALYAYEEEYGIIDSETDSISEIVATGARLMHLIDSIEPIHSTMDGEPF